MFQTTIDEAKKHLEELIEAAMRGERVVIAHDEQNAVQLVPVEPKAPAKRTRRAGAAKGQLGTAADFDEPLSDFNEYSI